MNRILRRAMQDSDRYVIEMDYADAKGNRTHRFVSPIRFMGSYRFLGLCLCREQPRQYWPYTRKQCKAAEKWFAKLQLKLEEEASCCGC